MGNRLTFYKHYSSAVKYLSMKYDTTLGGNIKTVPSSYYLYPNDVYIFVHIRTRYVL